LMRGSRSKFDGPKAADPMNMFTPSFIGKRSLRHGRYNRANRESASPK
jgi:hypothetical protein